MTDIVWKQIQSVLGYYASEEGEIIGPRGKLSLFFRKGYLKCQAGGKQRRVNRLVCEAFHGAPPSSEHEAAHRDGNSLNNKETNLYWATRAENIADLVNHGSFKGENHPRAKLTRADVDLIRSRKADGQSVKDIAREFPGISYSTICHASTGRNWK